MSSDWNACSLGDFVRLQRGHDLPASEQKIGAVPVMGSAGPNGTHDQALAKGPGVVIGRSGASAGRVHFSAVDYWPHNTCLYVTDFCGNNPRFAYYLLQTLPLASFNSGSAQPSLNRNFLYSIPLCIPALEEQDRIVGVLQALDDRITLLRETNATLEAIAQALFKSWFIDFDPVRAKMEGRAPEGMDEATAALFPDSFEETELGAVPRGWSVDSILSITSLLSGGTPKTDKSEYWGGEILWASAKDVSQAPDSVIIQSERKITQKGLDESSTKLIPRLATVVVARGATTGRLVMFGAEMAMNQTCYALVSRGDCPVALNMLVRREIQGLVKAAHGSVFDTITTATFAQSRCLIPSGELLRQFEQLVRPMFEKVIINVDMLQSLATLRDTLLPRLISGQLRLPEAQAELEAVDAV